MNKLKRQVGLSLPVEYEELLLVIKDHKPRFHGKSNSSIVRDMVNDWIEKNLTPEEWEAIKIQLSKKSQEAFSPFFTRDLRYTPMIQRNLVEKGYFYKMT